jgi:cytoskeletal protein RodZ
VLGETFRHAREAKGITASEAAAETHMMKQHVEALEEENFSSIAAPAYAKGFIRLYADYLELDSEPLIQEYTEQFMPQDSQVRLPGEPGEGEEGHSGGPGARFSLSDLKKIEWPFTFSKGQVAGVLGGVAMLILVVMLLNMVVKNRQSAPEQVAETGALQVPVQTSSSSPVLLQGPPEPFIDLYEQ